MCQTTAFCGSCKPIGWKQYVPPTHPQWNARWGSWHWAPGLSPRAIWGLKLCCMTVKPRTQHTYKYETQYIGNPQILAVLPSVTGCVKTLCSHLLVVFLFPCYFNKMLFMGWAAAKSASEMRQPLWSTTVCLSSCDFFPRAHPLNPKAHSGNLIVDDPQGPSHHLTTNV